MQTPSDLKHDLSHYIEEINLSLLQDYKQIRSRVSEDPGTAGDQAEETWSEVLKKWLPAHFHVVTKGRIISSSGEASPQIDVLVLWPSYPPFLLKKKLYLASGVAAAFECKLTLRKSHFRKLFQNAVLLSEITESEHTNRKILKQRTGQNYAYEEYHRMFEYGLLAHSYEGEDSKAAVDNFSAEITKLDAELVKHPKQMVDLICVQNLGSWVSERQAILGTPIMHESPPNTYTMAYVQHPYSGYHSLTKHSWAQGSSIQANFSPLGSFLTRLYCKLSRVDNSLLPLARFFVRTLSTGAGGGKGRLWNELHTPNEIWQMSAPKRLLNDSLHDDFSFLGF